MFSDFCLHDSPPPPKKKKTPYLFYQTTKILDWYKLNAFAYDKINMTEVLKIEVGRVENTVGKEENTGYQHFLLFQQCFQKGSVSASLKVGMCRQELIKT